MNMNASFFSCDIINCPNFVGVKASECKFYRIPRTDERRQAWLDAIGENAEHNHHLTQAYQLRQTYQLCSLHFKPDDFCKNRLKRRAIPSIFPQNNRADSADASPASTRVSIHADTDNEVIQQRSTKLCAQSNSKESCDEKADVDQEMLDCGSCLNMAIELSRASSELIHLNEGLNRNENRIVELKNQLLEKMTERQVTPRRRKILMQMCADSILTNIDASTDAGNSSDNGDDPSEIDRTQFVNYIMNLIDDLPANNSMLAMTTIERFLQLRQTTNRME